MWDKYLFERMPLKIEPEFSDPPRILRSFLQMPVIQRPAIINVAIPERGGPIMAEFMGLEVLPSPYMTEYTQVRYPKSKRKRIQKKFRKDASNWDSLPSRKIMRMGRTLVMHPQTLLKLQEEVHSQPLLSPLVQQIRPLMEEAREYSLRRTSGMR